jgi:sulfur relay (sulfurtransferase) DsrF/TusC family protein
MVDSRNGRIGLLVRSAPGASRESRADLDVALAALSLDRQIDVYFIGAAVLQLARNLDSAAAQLPPGYKAWAALHELGDVRLFAESSWLARCSAGANDLIGPPAGLDSAQMALHWRSCNAVWSL